MAMRKWATNPIKYNSIIAAEAFFLTVAIHLVLLVFFGYEPTVAKPVAHEGGVTSMLNLSSLSTPQKQRTLLWLDFHDPAAISRSSNAVEAPDYTGGADEHRALMSDMPRQDLPVVEPITEIPEVRVLPVTPVAGTPLKMLRPVAGAASSSPAESSDKSNLVLPMAFSDQGGQIPIKLTSSEQVMTTDVKLKFTVIELQRTAGDGLLCRFTIKKSSGRHELDLAAVRQIQENCAALLGSSDQAQVVIWWQKGDTL